MPSTKKIAEYREEINSSSDEENNSSSSSDESSENDVSSDSSSKIPISSHPDNTHKKTQSHTSIPRKTERLLDDIALGKASIPSDKVSIRKPDRRVATEKIIKNLCNSHYNILPRAAIKRILREVMNEGRSSPDPQKPCTMRIEKKALLIAQEAIEKYQCISLELANAMATHAGRITVKPSDIDLVMLATSATK